MQFRQHQLENGLEIVAEVKPASASMAAGFFVRTGSRDESPEIAGTSHFLEHMIFKGTPNRSAFEINRTFDDLGALYNAYTSDENTVFFAAVLPEYQKPILELLCDLMRPSLRQEDFDLEKDVILEEIAMYDDHPQFRLMEKLREVHFDGHPLGQSVLGTRESIGNLAREQMLDYFRLRYAPDNLTLVAVGQLDFEQLVRTAEDLCGGWEPAGTKRQTPPCTGSGRRETITDAKLNRQNIGLMNGAPSWQDERRFAAELLAHILGDSTGSRLYYALIEPGLADEAHCAYHALDGEGILMTYLSTAPEQASRAAEIVREEYRTFIEQGPTPQELEAAKNKIASSLTIRGEMPMGRLSAVGQEWVYRREYVPLRDQVEAIFAVTDRQVRRLAEGCRLPDATALALGPQENPWP